MLIITMIIDQHDHDDDDDVNDGQEGPLVGGQKGE